MKILVAIIIVLSFLTVALGIGCLKCLIHWDPFVEVIVENKSPNSCTIHLEHGKLILICNDLPSGQTETFRYDSKFYLGYKATIDVTSDTGKVFPKETANLHNGEKVKLYIMDDHIGIVKIQTTP